MDPLVRLLDDPPRDPDAERDPGFTLAVMDALPDQPRADLAPGWLWLAMAVAAGVLLYVPTDLLPMPQDIGDPMAITAIGWELAAAAVLIVVSVAVASRRPSNPRPQP